MNAEIVNIEGLFQEQISYRIPQFQRSYAWGEEIQWKPLWDDVRDVAEQFLNKEEDAKMRPHFMGAIVLQLQQSNTGEVTKRLVIDGQQRLTTLQLLIKATEQVFQSQGDTIRATRLSRLTINQENHWGGDNSNETKIRQANSDDRGAFRTSITTPDGRNRYGASAITKGYEYFEGVVGDWLNRETEDRITRADALEETLTKYFQMAVIDLDPDEKPHFIFETLNARGEHLKQSDLIKNTVMYEADVVDDPEKSRVFWGMFEHRWWEEKTDEVLQRSHIDRFLYHWMIMRERREVPINRVASRFRNYIELIGKPIEFVAEDIRHAAGIYKDIEETRIPEIKIALKRLKVMKLGAVTPLLLWLYTSEVSQEQRWRSVEALESCLVRRMLCGLRFNGLDQVVVSTLNYLEDPSELEAKLKESWTAFNYDFSNPSDIIAISFGEQWASDRDLYECLTSLPMRGAVARKKMVLEAVEMYLRGDKAEPILDTAKLTVEHVMPVKWHQNWQLPPDQEETEATNDREWAIKLIGNLTLTTAKLNTKLSNNPWDEKRKTLDNHSSLFLNKELLKASPDVWDETAIVNRSSDLAEIITKIWLPAETFLTP